MRFIHRINSFIWIKIPMSTKERWASRLSHKIEPGFVEYVQTTDGFKVKLEESSTFGDAMYNEYKFDDIRKDDIVLDLGANAGAFTLLAARMSDTVHAIEPLFTDILRENVALNPDLSDHITVHEMALGDGRSVHIRHSHREKTVETHSLKEIIDLCGGCTFLKMDIEGWEYSIPPEQFAGIPRIELEAHHHEGMIHPFNPALIRYIKANWNCSIDSKSDGSMHIHAYPKG